jgi:hypothetical protein
VLVLLLVCLNLGAASEAIAHDGPPAVMAHADPTCGEPVSGDEHGHLPCHACRPSLPLLPAPPAISVDACLIAVPVVYPRGPTLARAAPRILGPSPRGPPVTDVAYA